MIAGDEAYCRWKGWQDAAFAACSEDEQRYFDGEMNRLHTLGMPTATALQVLDLGFGNGAFAGYSRGRGWRWAGVEANEALVGKARAAGFDAWPPSEDLTGRIGADRLDLLVAFDVLEHMDVDGIKDVLGAARRVLRPGGFVLARVPSGDSPFGRAVAHGDITHRTILGSSAVLQLAGILGYSLEMVDGPCQPVGGAGIRRALRRLGVALARRIVAAGINAVFHDNAKRVISANMVFALRKPADQP